MGLNAALAMSGRALEVFTAGIQVSGQNVANASTPGYIRDELSLEANTPYRSGALVFGTGVLASGIVQQIDKFLETRIHTANTDLNTASSREAIFKQLEAEIGELGDGDLSTSLSGFLAAIQDVVNQPESAPFRQILLDRGAQFAQDIGYLRSRIDELRSTQTVAVDGLVQEANELIKKIDDLNPKIARLENSGLIKSDAGALRTQRYTALNRLSEILPIRFREREDGGVDVFTSNDYLILGGTIQTLETFPTVDRGVQVQSVQLSKTKSVISSNATGGAIRGIIEGRDQILGGFVDELDKFTASIIQEFNRIHTSGEGLEGYTSVTAQNFVVDPTAVLNTPSNGLNFLPSHGSFQLKVRNKITGLTETTTVTIDLDGIGADTTLNSLRASIDGINNISASITTNGNLQIDADPNFEIRFADDTSGVLSSLGINTFFSGFDSQTIAVNPAIAANQNLIATGQGGGPSDSRNAALLAEFSRIPASGLNGLSLDEFYELTITAVGQASAAETSITDGLRGFQESLFSQREQFSGVSVDEEAIKILQYQHSFQAAARMISTIDELFTVLLTM